MRTFHCQTLHLVAGLLASVLALSLTSDSQQKQSALSLTIRSKDQRVKTGSPIWVDVSETNNSDHILSIGRAKPLSMDQGGEAFIVDVWDDAGSRPGETTFYGRKLGHLTPKKIGDLSVGSGIVLALKPGETRTDRIDVGRLYDLSRPGKYTVQVQLPIKSNKIVVTVIP